MRIKIISDGTPTGTQILNAQTGEEIGQLVGALRFEADWNDPTRCSLGTVWLRFFFPDVELTGDLTAAEVVDCLERRHPLLVPVLRYDTGSGGDGAPAE